MRQKQKKPTWRNTMRYSTTSAYSSTGFPAKRPLDCPSSSHPTIFETALESNELSLDSTFIVPVRPQKARRQLDRLGIGANTFDHVGLLVNEPSPRIWRSAL